MKIKKHLQIDAITNSTGRLPSDMENLTVYHHSSSKDEPINVGDMDLTYLIRAYAKCQRQLAQDVRIDTQEGRNLELTSKVENLNSIIAEKDELLDKLAFIPKGIVQEQLASPIGPRISLIFTFY